MTNSEEQVERRKHKLFRVLRTVFVAVRPHFDTVGRLIDIGMDGLAFAYLDSEKRARKSLELDIFSKNGDFYLQKVPCETISDLKAYESPFGPIIMRKCTVKFEELTPRQKTDLERFIKDHTIDEE